MYLVNKYYYMPMTYF